MTPRASSDRPAFSARTRALLEQRLVELDARIVELEQQVSTWPEDPHTSAALLAAREESRRLRATLAAAIDVEELPDDPDVAEIADTVRVRHLETDSQERFTIVHETEARLDDTWISAGSPLGSAFLGHRAGDVVTVRTPNGLDRYEILAVWRDRAAGPSSG
jgi:transcription elongation GreA/GreB family factor